MANYQDIAEVTFDVATAQKTGAAVIKVMDDVFASVEKLDGKKVALGGIAGLGDFKKLQAEIKAGFTDLNTSVDNYNKKLTDYVNTTKAATETAKQQTEASKQTTEQFKQQTETQKQSTEQSKQSATAKVAEAKASTENARQKDVETKTTITLTKEQERQQKISEKQAKITRDNSDEYKQFVKQVNEAALAAKRLQLTSPGSPEAAAATTKAVALKKQLTELNESTGNFTDNVGNYAGKIGGLFTKAYGYIRTAANILPGVGISGIFLLGFDAIMKVVEAFGLFDNAAEKAAETQRKLNDIRREELEIDKQIEAATKSRLNLESQTNETTQSRENALNVAKEENKSKAELLKLEQGLADARALQANQAFMEKGGFDKEDKARSEITKQRLALMDLENELKRVQTEGTTNEDATGNPFKSREAANKEAEESLKTAIDNQKKLVDDSIKNYDEVKSVNEENAASIAAQQQKQIEAQTYFEAQRRKLVLEGARIEQDAIKDTNSRILSDQRSTLSERLTAIKSNLAAQKTIIQAEKNNVLTDPSASAVDKTIATKKAFADSIKASRDAQKQIFDTNLEFFNRRLQATKETQDIELNSLKTHDQDIVNEQQRSISDRLAAQSRTSETQKKLIQNDYEYQKTLLDEKNTTDEEYKRLEADKDAKLVQLATDTQQSITKILRDEIEKRKADQEDYLSFLTSDLNNNTSQLYAADVIALNKSFQAKKIGVDEYERDRKKIEDKYARVRLQDNEKEIRARLSVLDTQKAAQQSITSDIIDLSAKMSEATTDAEREGINNQIKAKQNQLEAYKGINQAILDNTTALNTNLAAQSNTESEREKDLANRTADAKKKAVEGFYDLMVTIGDAGYVRELNHIQDLMDANDLQYNQEIKNIQNSSLSAQQKEADTILAEAKHSAQSTILQKRQRDEQLKQAKFDRDTQALKILGETLYDAAKAGWITPLAIAIEAIGAFQIAALYAKPLPKFFKGVSSSPEGPAITDELGPELYINKAGEMTLGSADGPNIKYLEQGTRIIPHDQVNEYLQDIILKQQVNSFSTNSDINLTDIKTANAIDRQTTVLKKAILSTRNDNAPITKRELSAFADQIAKKEWLRGAMDRYTKW